MVDPATAHRYQASPSHLFLDRVTTPRFRSESGPASHSFASFNFSSAAGSATEKEVKGFYQFLADWEKQHLEALRTLYNSVRQDFFAAGSFSPF